MFWRRVGTQIKQIKLWFLVLIPILALAALLYIIVDTNPRLNILNVDFRERVEIAPVQEIQVATSGDPSKKQLRVAVAGVLSPTKTLEHYRELLTLMEQKFGRRILLILKPTYVEINDLLRDGHADMAFVCSLAYVKGNQDFGMELLVVPQMDGVVSYYSYLIVPKDSTISSLEELKGASFAFTDPMSNTGHMAPSYQLLLQGKTPASHFSRFIFTYSHDNSIMTVANKLVQGAAVDSLVYDKLIKDNAELARMTRVVTRWGPYGIPPVVISPNLDSQFKEQLRDFFLNIHSSSEGVTILHKLDIEKFVIAPDSIYDSIREMKKRLGWK